MKQLKLLNDMVVDELEFKSLAVRDNKNRNRTIISIADPMDYFIVCGNMRYSYDYFDDIFK